MTARSVTNRERNSATRSRPKRSAAVSTVPRAAMTAVTRTARKRIRTRTNKTHNLQAVFAPKLQSRRGLFLVRQRVAAVPTGRLRYFSIFASAISRLSDGVSEKGALSAAGSGKLLT